MGLDMNFNANNKDYTKRLLNAFKVLQDKEVLKLEEGYDANEVMYFGKSYYFLHWWIKDNCQLFCEELYEDTYLIKKEDLTNIINVCNIILESCVNNIDKDYYDKNDIINNDKAKELFPLHEMDNYDERYFSDVKCVCVRISELIEDFNFEDYDLTYSYSS